MIRIGIVGAENTHSGRIAETLNVRKSVRGFRVEAIWGETRKLAEQRAEQGDIPLIVQDPAEMVERIDAVIIDHRHPKYHLPAAEPFLKAKLPIFIDKPFCYRLAAGKKFLQRARRMKVPVTSFSTIPTSKSFAALARRVKKAGKVYSASSFGPCDVDSPYGGIFFYGIHQLDVLMELFGPEIVAVSLTQSPKGKDAVASLFWKSGLTAALHCVKEYEVGFRAAVAGEKDTVAERIVADDDPYLAGIRIFTKMFKTGVEPIEHKRILATVAVLEAMEKAADSGKIEKVAKP
jgi:predicted dehydrogenase